MEIYILIPLSVKQNVGGARQNIESQKSKRTTYYQSATFPPAVQMFCLLSSLKGMGNRDMLETGELLNDKDNSTASCHLFSHKKKTPSHKH